MGILDFLLGIPLSTWAYWLTWALAMSGAACIGLAATGLRARYVGHWTKIAPEAAQLASASVGIGAAFAPTPFKAEWLWPAIYGTAGLFLWKVVQWLGDYVKSANQENLEERLENAEALSYAATARGTAITQLLTTLHSAVHHKWNRIRATVRSRGIRNPSIADVRNALKPKEHLEKVLVDLAVFLREQLQPELRRQRNFRVALYAESAGIMKPACGVSLNHADYDPFTSYKEHEAVFQLDAGDSAAEVVKCVKNKNFVIVADCAAAAAAGLFTYYKQPQCGYLRSMVAYYVGRVMLESGETADAALVVDTDEPGYFKPEDEDFIKLCLDEFAARMFLEMALVALLRRKRDDNANRGQKAAEAGETRADPPAQDDGGGTGI